MSDGRTDSSANQRKISDTVVEFLGLSPAINENYDWNNRRSYFMSRSFMRSGTNSEVVDSGSVHSSDQRRRKPSVVEITADKITKYRNSRVIAEDTPVSSPPKQNLDIAEPPIPNFSKQETFLWSIIGRKFKKIFQNEYYTKLDERSNYRPYFTYWLMFVQIVVMIVAVSIYGFAPIGYQTKEERKFVLKPDLGIVPDVRYIVENIWLGPEQAHLVHMGAKYSPCMRVDGNIQYAVETDRHVEEKTSCCVRNDGSGCYQTLETQCSINNALWDQSNGSSSVCGQDPLWCLDPASVGMNKWPQNIVKWPICLKSAYIPKSKRLFNDGLDHMRCEITGRPCCVRLQAECIITTMEHCQFLQGFYHPEATLCSQVNCMQSICGMLPFVVPNKPDQFYRTLTTLFLHAGIFHLIITLLGEYLVMIDVEKLIGSLRAAIIFFLSGVAGTLTSAVLMPYVVDCGPSGALMGVLAVPFVELAQQWKSIRDPETVLMKLSAIISAHFIFGFLPYIDNSARIGGFIMGILISFVVVPHMTIGQWSVRVKRINLLVFLALALSMLGILVTLLYLNMPKECRGCEYFNCIPLVDGFCRNIRIEIRRLRPGV